LGCFLFFVLSGESQLIGFRQESKGVSLPRVRGRNSPADVIGDKRTRDPAVQESKSFSLIFLKLVFEKWESCTGHVMTDKRTRGPAGIERLFYVSLAEREKYPRP
jgi:hypothetical protein